MYGTSPTPITNLIIDGNEIHNTEPATTSAITINGNVKDFEVTNNKVHDVNHTAIEFLGGEPWTGGYIAQDGLCKGNTVYRAISAKGGGNAAGIRVDGAKNITIEANRVYNNDVGIEIGAWRRDAVTTEIIIRRNLIYNNNKTGIFLGSYAKRRGMVKDSKLYNNVLYRNQLTQEGDGELFIQFLPLFKKGGFKSKAQCLKTCLKHQMCDCFRNLTDVNCIGCMETNLLFFFYYS